MLLKRLPQYIIASIQHSQGLFYISGTPLLQTS